MYVDVRLKVIHITSPFFSISRIQDGRKQWNSPISLISPICRLFSSLVLLPINVAEDSAGRLRHRCKLDSWVLYISDSRTPSCHLQWSFCVVSPGSDTLVDQFFLWKNPCQDLGPNCWYYWKSLTVSTVKGLLLYSGRYHHHRGCCG